MSKAATDQYVEKLNQKCLELFKTDIKSYLREQTINKRIPEDICKDFGIGAHSVIEVYRNLGIIWHKRAITKKVLFSRDVMRKRLAASHAGPFQINDAI